MSLLERINEDFKNAYKNKEESKVSALRMVKAALLVKEKESGTLPTDEQTQDVLWGLVKKHKDSIELYKQGGRQDLVSAEEIELRIVMSYLPQQMSEEDVRAEVSRIHATLPDDVKAHFGATMGKIMAELKGRADGGIVNRVVKEMLGK